MFIDIGKIAITFNGLRNLLEESKEGAQNGLFENFNFMECAVV